MQYKVYCLALLPGGGESMIEKCDRCGREDEVVRAYGRLFCPNCVEELSYKKGVSWYLRRAAERERRERGCRRER